MKHVLFLPLRAPTSVEKGSKYLGTAFLEGPQGSCQERNTQVKIVSGINNTRSY